MKQTIVITGSTRGIGRGLAAEFLKLGCNVFVTGRSEAAVAAVVAELTPLGPVAGCPCDVRRAADHAAVWAQAVERFGRVDVWINNAAVATDRLALAELPADQVEATVDTNLTGAMLGTRAALAGMQQQGGGQIFLFEGFGSDGMTTPGLTVYGTTKRALRYFTAAMAKECGKGPVLIGSLSPGLVATDLLVYSSRSADPAEWARAKRVMNILADRVETVTPWLAAAALANTKQGASIAWLTRRKAFWRFLTAAFRRRDLIAEIEAKSALVVR